METNPPSSAGLYAKLLGDSWWRLHGAVRHLHAEGPVHAAGVFRVRHGVNWLARTLAWLARLPAAGEAVDVRLQVSPKGPGEEWRRLFAARPFVSLQCERAGGLLGERMGLLELRFLLQVDQGALAYETSGAALCLGSLRLPLPRWLRPSVSALERPDGEANQVEVFVEARLPLLGRLITYEGKLTRVEAQQ